MSPSNNAVILVTMEYFHCHNWRGVCGRLLWLLFWYLQISSQDRPSGLGQRDPWPLTITNPIHQSTSAHRKLVNNSWHHCLTLDNLLSVCSTNSSVIRYTFKVLSKPKNKTKKNTNTFKWPHSNQASKYNLS